MPRWCMSLPAPCAATNRALPFPGSKTAVVSSPSTAMRHFTLGPGARLFADDYRSERGELAGLAQHLVHIGGMDLLGVDHLADEFLQCDEAPFDQRQQLAV